MGSFGLKKMFDNMVVRYMPNSGHGGPPGSPFMTIFVSYVGPHFQYSIFGCMWGYMKLYKAIWRYMKVYGGIWRYMKVYKPI